MLLSLVILLYKADIYRWSRNYGIIILVLITKNTKDEAEDIRFTQFERQISVPPAKKRAT